MPLIEFNPINKHLINKNKNNYKINFIINILTFLIMLN